MSNTECASVRLTGKTAVQQQLCEGNEKSVREAALQNPKCRKMAGAPGAEQKFQAAQD